MGTIHRLRMNWFMVGIVAVTGAGLALPGLAALNPGGIVTNIIVVLLFLGIGFTLPGEAVVAGLRNFKLHLFLQIFIFVLTPLFFLLSSGLFGFPPEVRLGIYALSALPTTISTCIVLTQAAGGNTAGSMFNAALANVSGVLLSPLILSLMLRQAGRSMPMELLLEIVIGLGWKMILPLIAGQLLHLRFRSAADAGKGRISALSNLLIIILVLLSMAKSAGTPEFFTRLSSMGWVLLYLALAHYVIIALALAGGKVFGFSREDRISIAYVAPQKTLAMGVPLLGAYFAWEPQILGVVLLPLLFYHPWQIVNAGLIRLLPFESKKNRQSDSESGGESNPESVQKINRGSETAP